MGFISVVSLIVEAVRSSTAVMAVFQVAAAMWCATAYWFLARVVRDAESPLPPPWWEAWGPRWGVLGAMAIPLTIGWVLVLLR
jgi:hypothetical protein